MSNENSIESPYVPEKQPEMSPEMKAEQERQRTLVKESLYPLLLKNSKSIEDAKNMLYAASTAIHQAFQKKIMERQVEMSKQLLSDLEISSIMQSGEEFDRDRELMDLFKDETIATASGLIEGMKGAIDSFQREESTKRSLDTLKTDFL